VLRHLLTQVPLPSLFFTRRAQFSVASMLPLFNRCPGKDRLGEGVVPFLAIAIFRPSSVASFCPGLRQSLA